MGESGHSPPLYEDQEFSAEHGDHRDTNLMVVVLGPTVSYARKAIARASCTSTRSPARRAQKRDFKSVFL